MDRSIISIVRGGPSPEEQLPVLKRAGWDGVFFTWTGTQDDRSLVAAIGREGLALQSVHAPYDRADVLWESDEEGEAEVLRQIACIRDAASWGCGLVVMHAVVGMERISPKGGERERAFRLFGRIFEAAREAGVLVALENTEGEQYLDALLTHFRGHPAVRFCIDTGHEMCYDHGHDLIGKYSDLLYCTHQDAHHNHTFPHDHIWIRINGTLKRGKDDPVPDYRNYP